MKRIRLEINVNDNAVKGVVKAAKVFVKAIISLANGHNAKVNVEDLKNTESKTKK